MGKSSFWDNSISDARVHGPFQTAANHSALKRVLYESKPVLLLLHRSRTALQTDPHLISFTLCWYTALNCQTLYRDVRISEVTRNFGVDSTMRVDSSAGVDSDSRAIQSRGIDSFGVDSPSLHSTINKYQPLIAERQQRTLECQQSNARWQDPVHNTNTAKCTQ